MENQKKNKKIEFADSEFNFPDDITREEFEKIFSKRMKSLHRKETDFACEPFDEKSRKENLKPLSIRVKPRTKEFYKHYSILSPREVLEMYEEYNNGSEAFINSLLEDEKSLKQELNEVQEKLHSAKLFKEKLGEINLGDGIFTDQEKILKVKLQFESSEIKAIGNETSVGKAKNDIIRDIQIYNTLIIRVYSNQVLSIGVYTNAEPIVYYFKNEYSKDEISEILKYVEQYCADNGIQYQILDTPIFEY